MIFRDADTILPLIIPFKAVDDDHVAVDSGSKTNNKNKIAVCVRESRVVSNSNTFRLVLKVFYSGTGYPLYPGQVSTHCAGDQLSREPHPKLTHCLTIVAAPFLPRCRLDPTMSIVAIQMC